MSDPTTPQPPEDRPEQPPAGGYGQQPDYGPPPAYGGQPPAYGGGQPPTYGGPPQQYGAPTPDEITWGCAAHWSALVASIVALAFLGPLIVMLTKGNQSAYVRRQSVESLNFQLSILIYGIVSFILLFVLVGFILLPIVGIMWLVFTIIGAVRASRGEEYRYPVTIRMVS